MQGGGYYSGEWVWNLNPGFIMYGGYNLPQETAESKDTVEIEVIVTVIDSYGREHTLLPVVYRYLRNQNAWNFEPHSRYTKS